MSAIRAAILAGGEARRLDGLPKGLVKVGGERILDTLAARLLGATGALPLLIANAAEAASWRPDLRLVPDRRPGGGVLGGLLTALHEAPAPVLVLAWDMPFVPEGLLRRLVSEFQETDVLLPQSGGPRGVEPLCAVYGPGCVPAVERCLERGDRRAVAFHSEIRVRRLPLEVVRDFGDPERIFFNVNSYEDLVRAQEY